MAVLLGHKGKEQHCPRIASLHGEDMKKKKKKKNKKKKKKRRKKEDKDKREEDKTAGEEDIEGWEEVENCEEEDPPEMQLLLEDVACKEEEGCRNTPLGHTSMFCMTGKPTWLDDYW